MDKFKDDFIRKKMQEDNYIPKKVNNVFENFKKNPSKFVNFNINTLETDDDYIEASKNRKKSDRHNENNHQNLQNTSFFTYKNINKFLSVAAVFLCIILVGMGTLLKNRPTEIENIDIITKSVSVKNHELMFSNEEVIKCSENNLVKASLIKDNQVAIQLKENFINLYNLNLSSDKQYEVSNITKNVEDVFVGCMVSFDIPYVLLVMEDGTAECIQILNGISVHRQDYEFNFYSQGKINGLYNVVGFEQCTRNYANSNKLFYYINAIRADGKRKEIDLGYYNDWNDTSTITFDIVNEKYLNKNTENGNINDKTNNEVRDNEDENINKNIEYIQSQTDSNISYYLDNSNLYKLDKTSNSTSCIASGVTSFYKDEDGKLMAWLDENYTINKTDYNILFSEFDVSKANRVVEMKSSDEIKVELKDDGSLTFQLSKGGLKRLGLEGKTNIRENVRYNFYDDIEDVYNEETGNYVADAKTFIIGLMGPDETLSIVYAKKNDTIVCIDLKAAISENNLHLRRVAMYGIDNIQAFKEDILYRTIEDGGREEWYRTIWAIQRLENGESDFVPLKY